MKNNKNLRTICLSLVAMALIITLNVENALAYFTTYTTAKGGVTLDLEFPSAKIEEEVVVNENSGYKKITLTNTGNVDCYVRMKAFAGRDLKYSASATDKTAPVIGWTLKDGYYEYSNILKPDETTSTPVYVHFEILDGDTNFNVIIIQECTSVLHDNAGNVLPVDWNTETNNPTTFVGTAN